MSVVHACVPSSLCKDAIVGNLFKTFSFHCVNRTAPRVSLLARLRRNSVHELIGPSSAPKTSAGTKVGHFAKRPTMPTAKTTAKLAVHCVTHRWMAPDCVCVGFFFCANCGTCQVWARYGCAFTFSRPCLGIVSMDCLLCSKQAMQIQNKVCHNFLKL